MASCCEQATGRGSKKSQPQARATVATTAAPAPSDPKRLAVTSDSVTIGWAAPTDSPAPDRYTILIDGHDSATIDGAFPSSTPEYRVTGLSFGTPYSIQVRARWLPGGQSKPSSAIAVLTPYPPVSQARLDGSAGVPVKFTVRATNWIDFPVGKVFTNRWTLTPTCPSPYVSAGRYYCPGGRTVATIGSSQEPAI